MKKLLLILILFPNILFAGSMKMIGEEGKLNEVDRIIKIKMYDNYYIPTEIKIIPIRPFPTGSSPINKKAPKVTNNGAIPLIKGYTSLKSPQL